MLVPAVCGHAVIALGKWAVLSGVVKPPPALPSPVDVRIQAPCGIVRASVAVDASGKPGAVSFVSVPAFVLALDVPVTAVRRDGTPTPLTVDVAYGGAFYAFAPASAFGLDVRASPVRDLVDAADAVTAAVRAAVEVAHPDSPDLSFLYGTILTDGRSGCDDVPDQVWCVFVPVCLSPSLSLSLNPSLHSLPISLTVCEWFSRNCLAAPFAEPVSERVRVCGQPSGPQCDGLRCHRAHGAGGRAGATVPHRPRRMPAPPLPVRDGRGDGGAAG